MQRVNANSITRISRSVIVICLAILSSCDLPQKIAEQRQERAAANDQADDATCQSYGLTFGTPAYADCRQNIATQRQANAARALDYIQQENQENQQILLDQQQRIQQQEILNRPVMTNCNTFGTQTNCTTQPGL